MRILFLTPQLPYPLHQGTAIRNFGLIQGLSERHQVSLLSFRDADHNKQDLDPSVPDPLLRLCEKVETVRAPAPRPLTQRGLDTLIHPLPDMALRLASPVFGERLAAWLAQELFDVVHIEGIEMTPYLDLLLSETERRKVPSASYAQAGAEGQRGPKRGPPLIIFDDHNCEYMLQKSYAKVDARNARRWPGALYSLIQWQKLRRYEAQVCRRAHHVLAVSQTDADALQQLVPGLCTTVIPNGIDTAQYDPLLEPRMGETPAVVFTGKMDFRPNVDAVRWFANEIWPRVRDAVPETHFYVVGQRPHSQLSHLGSDLSVTLTGWVDDVRPYVAGAQVYVVPLRMGSGTRLKLLEAMAMGKAIVSTWTGAEGFTARESALMQGEIGQAQVEAGQIINDKELVLIADNDPVGFAEAIIALLRDPDRRARLGAAARTFAGAHYDWRVIVPRLEALYAQALGDRRKE